MRRAGPAKRLLLVSYEFPPKGGTQSQHVVALADGLARNGWDVDVLTVADPPAPMIDARPLERLARNVTVHAAWSAEPTRVVQWVGHLRTRTVACGVRRATAVGAEQPPDAAAETRTRGYTGLPRWAIRAVQALFVPDEKIGWSPFAQALASRLHRRAPFAAVVSSGPPFSAHSIARCVARRYSVPWLADLRDPIVGGYFFKPLTPVNAWLMERFERRVLKGASAVIVSTQGIRQGIVARHPDVAARVRVVPNGFDVAAFRHARRLADGAGAASASAGAFPPLPHEGFVVSYVGTFQANIRPDAFLAAVARLRAGDPDGFGAQVRVRFVGPRDADTEAAVSAAALDDVVERTGFVAHEQAVEAMLVADVLLLVIGPEPESRQILTSKLPEYFAAGRPVLALVPPDGVAADFVRRAGNGAVVQSEDIDGAARALAAMYADWQSGRRRGPAPEVVEEFDRTTLMAELDVQLCALTGCAPQRTPSESPAAGGDPR